MEIPVSPEKNFLPFPGFPIPTPRSVVPETSPWPCGGAPRSKTPWEHRNFKGCREMGKCVWLKRDIHSSHRQKAEVADGTRKEKRDATLSWEAGRHQSCPPWAFSIPFTNFSPWRPSLASDNKRFQKPALLPSQPSGLTSLV